MAMTSMTAYFDSPIFLYFNEIGLFQKAACRLNLQKLGQCLLIFYLTYCPKCVFSEMSKTKLCCFDTMMTCFDPLPI